MKSYITEKPNVDLVKRYHNDIWAVYVIGKDLLEAEKDLLEAENKLNLAGVPFLVHLSSLTPTSPLLIQAREREGVPYLSRSQLEDMENCLITKGNIPNRVEVYGRNYYISDLLSRYVPYSGGIFHDSDKKEKRRVRGDSDYYNFVNKVIPQVIQKRTNGTKIPDYILENNNVLTCSIGILQ